MDDLLQVLLVMEQLPLLMEELPGMDRRAAGDGTRETVDGRGQTATVQGAVGESRVSFQCCHVAAGNRQIVIRRS